MKGGGEGGGEGEGRGEGRVGGSLPSWASDCHIIGRRLTVFKPSRCGGDLLTTAHGRVTTSIPHAFGIFKGCSMLNQGVVP
ncbi:hypothetical protein CLOM_g23164 [Closterium sp. NIES-68]|nr:hypothetical protein CLOM_g23164 [Closterium sp. NIES-68]